jgi:hypothetical protein
MNTVILTCTMHNAQCTCHSLTIDTVFKVQYSTHKSRILFVVQYCMHAYEARLVDLVYLYSTGSAQRRGMNGVVVGQRPA